RPGDTRSRAAAWFREVMPVLRKRPRSSIWSYAPRGRLVNILSLFWRRPPRSRRTLTPAEARAQQAAALNAPLPPLQQMYGASQNQGSGRTRRDGDGRQTTRHAYLAAHGVEKTFAGRMVVKGVTLYVRRGEAVGLLGPNGAGKTTVFYMITGLINADRGRI